MELFQTSLLCGPLVQRCVFCPSSVWSRLLLGPAQPPLLSSSCPSCIPTSQRLIAAAVAVATATPPAAAAAAAAGGGGAAAAAAAGAAAAAAAAAGTAAAGFGANADTQGQYLFHKTALVDQWRSPGVRLHLMCCYQCFRTCAFLEYLMQASVPWSLAHQKHFFRDLARAHTRLHHDAGVPRVLGLDMGYAATKAFLLRTRSVPSLHVFFIQSGDVLNDSGTQIPGFAD